MDLFEKCHNEFMQMVEGLKRDNVYPYFTELTSGQIGRASCRERVSSPV